MKVGTKSVLFGVHAFWWHPITVALAWRKVHGRWPGILEWIAIFTHDLGYWGKENMDGKEGLRHPVAGALLAYKLAYWWTLVCCFLVSGRLKHKVPRLSWACFRAKANAWHTYSIALRHSRTYSRIMGSPVSELFLPDKVSVLYDPVWFYLLRASLSGEHWEYIQVNAPHWLIWEPRNRVAKTWLLWYRGKVKKQLAKHQANERNIQLLKSSFSRT